MTCIIYILLIYGIKIFLHFYLLDFIGFQIRIACSVHTLKRVGYLTDKIHAYNQLDIAFILNTSNYGHHKGWVVLSIFTIEIQFDFIACWDIAKRAYNAHIRNGNIVHIKNNRKQSRDIGITLYLNGNATIVGGGFNVGLNYNAGKCKNYVFWMIK